MQYTHVLAWFGLLSQNLDDNCDREVGEPVPSNKTLSGSLEFNFP